MDEIDIPSWPLVTPDHSPMKYVWHLIGRGCTASTVTPPAHIAEGLRVAVDAAWQGVAQVTIEGIDCNMPRRLVAYIAARGSTLIID